MGIQPGPQSMGGLRPQIDLGPGQSRAKFEHMPRFKTSSASQRRTTFQSPVIKAKTSSALSKTAGIINDLEMNSRVNNLVGRQTAGP
jgi:hypothetical protein